MEFDVEFGQQNAVHLIMRMATTCDILPLIKYLIEYVGISYEALDCMGRNPFLLRACVKPTQNFDSTIEFLLEQDSIKVDLPTKTGKTPALLYYKESNINNVNKLLSLGADINAIDNAGFFLLKFALIRRDES